MAKIAFIKYGDAPNEYRKCIGANPNYIQFDAIGSYMNEILKLTQNYKVMVISFGNRYASITDNGHIFTVIPAHNEIIKYIFIPFIYLKLFCFRPSLIVSFGTPVDALFMSGYSFLFSTPFVPFFAGEFYESYGKKIYRKITDFLILKILKCKHIKIVCARSEFVKKQLLKKGIQKDKIIVYNLEYTENYFAEYDVNNEVCGYEFKVIFIGRLTHRKGIYTYLEVAKELTSRIKDIKFYIIGDGPECPNIRALIEKNHLEDKVIMLGPKPSYMIHSYLKSIDVLCIPSFSESFCKVAFEGILSGVPIVCSKIGALEELVIDGEIGYLVDPNNIQGFCDKIKLLYENRNLYCRFKENIIKRKRKIPTYLTPSLIISNLIRNKYSF